MKLIWGLIIFAYSLFFTYEYAFRFGVESEKLNSYLSEQKVKNCLEIISER